MLDVHPPHEKMHGFKDFLLHLLTITIGLLIALGLEGCAERWHHRELRKEADANLVQEIRDNERDLAVTREAVGEEKKNLLTVLGFLKAKSAGKPYEIHSINLNFTSSNLNDASWKTATGMGTLSYMEYSRVQQFASAYQQQELFTRIELETIDNYLQLQSYIGVGFDPDAMSPEEARAALPEVRQTLTHLMAMDGVAAAVRLTYEKALAGKE